MPRKPARPCKQQGCPNLTDDYLGYCTEHKKKVQTQYDSQRPSAARRGYNARWRRRSKLFLKKHPTCVECKNEGKVRPAVLVDHIIPHRGDKKLFWDESNWQGLCKKHHDRKTAKEKGMKYH